MSDILEDIKELYNEKEKINIDEYQQIKSNNNFSLSSINFIKVQNNLKVVKKNNEKRLFDKNNENIDSIVFNLKSEMRKELYKLIDESQNKIISNNLIGKKRNSEVPLDVYITKSIFAKK